MKSTTPGPKYVPPAKRENLASGTPGAPVLSKYTGEVKVATGKAEWYIENVQLNDLRQAWRKLQAKAAQVHAFEFQLGWEKSSERAFCSVFALDWFDFVETDDSRENWKNNFFGQTNPNLRSSCHRVKWDLHSRVHEAEDLRVLMLWAKAAVDESLRWEGREVEVAAVLGDLHANLSRWFQWFEKADLKDFAKELLTC